MFEGLRRNYYAAILADPPSPFATWSDKGKDRSAENHYGVMSFAEIMAMPVAELAADDCVLFLWATWPTLPQAMSVIEAWGFRYKTCAFTWAKVKNGKAQIGLGYWSRANTEPCLLATRGKPKRIHADVSQLIMEPRREHSRKPDCVHDRIERLVDGPRLELFARQRRMEWDCWGDQVDRFPERDIFFPQTAMSDSPHRNKGDAE